KRISSLDLSFRTFETSCNQMLAMPGNIAIVTSLSQVLLTLAIGLPPISGWNRNHAHVLFVCLLVHVRAGQDKPSLALNPGPFLSLLDSALGDRLVRGIEPFPAAGSDSKLFGRVKAGQA